MRCGRADPRTELEGGEARHAQCLGCGASRAAGRTCPRPPQGMRRLSGLAGAVIVLHLLGWGLFWWYSRHYAALAGLGTLAYAFGLRHAFDADHIAAIDNTTRKLVQDGKRPLGVGFFFSLGHSTVVLSLATGRSEEHTSELQSLRHLVCRLLLEK